MKKYVLVFSILLFLVGCKKIVLTPQQEALKREIWNSPNYTLLLTNDGTIYVLKHLVSDRITFCASNYPCTNYSFDNLDIKTWGTRKIIRPNDKEYLDFAFFYIQQR